MVKSESLGIEAKECGLYMKAMEADQGLPLGHHLLPKVKIR